MLAKEITYLTANGETITETFWFNLNKKELAEIAFEKADYAEWLASAERGFVPQNEILKEFEALIVKAYGQKSKDGRSFIKTPEQTIEFICSDAYSELFIELISSEEKISNFIRGIVPAAVSDTFAKAVEDTKNQPPLNILGATRAE